MCGLGSGLHESQHRGTEPLNKRNNISQRINGMHPKYPQYVLCACLQLAACIPGKVVRAQGLDVEPVRMDLQAGVKLAM